MRAVQAVSLLWFVLAASCSSAQKVEDASSTEPPQTTIEVRNQKPVDYTVYVVDGTRRIRLGMVTGMSNRTLLIPAHMVAGRGSLRFQFDPIGSNQVVSTDEELTVREGDALSLTLQ
ncbi:hypothetical protein [Hyalangium rubrum]|uniref:Lipoprotein n=1 Tax=Hyalangium rubrum TaxID=3103134 RepID=A0ABU5HEQ9_9BACT|nr:hypothetical protein [Hyalangium sp. s54d21]MDY7231736.1 hypothetical protein [Hyalangium sp. s54d21]